MKLDELHPMVEVIPNDIQSCHDRIESLEDRLNIAKYLLCESNEVLDQWTKQNHGIGTLGTVMQINSVKKLISKLDSEGL